MVGDKDRQSCIEYQEAVADCDRAQVRKDVAWGKYLRVPNSLLAEPFEPPLDVEIARAVASLRHAGIETYASCQGGEGHPYPCPTVSVSTARSPACS